MSWSRWEGPAEPPDDAYSRVTNPERFAPLHAAAEELLDGLEKAFDLERTEGYGLDPELESVELQRPTVRLAPRDPGSAPLTIAFSRFPGLFIRAGHWHREPLPSCGCDACNETAEDCIQLLQRIVANVTEGRFREAIQLPALPLPIVGRGWRETRLWDITGGSTTNRARLDRSEAMTMLAGKEHSTYDWKPWPKR